MTDNELWQKTLIASLERLPLSEAKKTADHVVQLELERRFAAGTLFTNESMLAKAAEQRTALLMAEPAQQMATDPLEEKYQRTADRLKKLLELQKMLDQIDELQARLK